MRSVVVLRRPRPLIVLTFLLIAAPFVVNAQQPAQMLRIGRLWPISASAGVPAWEAFLRGLRELGWVDGQNIRIEHRFADGKPDRLPALAAELVRRPVDIIVAGSIPGALAAKNATSAIPIVAVTTGDPVASGVISSLAHPRGNLTGVTALGTVLSAKRLELLKEAIPGLGHVAVLWNPNSPDTAPAVKALEDAARAVAVKLRVLDVRDPNEFDKAFAAIRSERVGALMVQPDIMLDTHRMRIIEFAARSRVPAMYAFREHAQAGGLMFYGADLADMWHRAAYFVNKILRGAKPGELPIEQPTKFELVINLKTARALGLAFPPSLALRADQIIE